MDRDEIERQDFPAARRGYDAAAVHDHLRRVADEFEALAARPREASLAEGTSAQVRAILEAAETGARELREDAGREAREHVELVGDAARELLSKLDRLQDELDRLLGGLRTTAQGLAGSLDELSRDVGTLRGPAKPSAPASADNGARSDDEAGARLVALNMALEGRPREQAATYLEERYEVSDVEALLDDVYASAGK